MARRNSVKFSVKMGDESVELKGGQAIYEAFLESLEAHDGKIVAGDIRSRLKVGAEFDVFGKLTAYKNAVQKRIDDFPAKMEEWNKTAESERGRKPTLPVAVWLPALPATIGGTRERNRELANNQATRAAALAAKFAARAQATA